MKYAYELKYANGFAFFSVQDYHFTEEQMLKACKESGDSTFTKVCKVTFLMEVPKGYHVCGCGNLAKGSRDELCDECRELYGHTYEHEL